MFKHSLTRTLVLITPLALLTACSDEGEISTPPEESTPVSHAKVFNVGETTYQKQPAIYISFGENEQNTCSITFLKSALHAGFDLSVGHTYKTDISARCTSNGTYYSTSSKHPTNVSVKIIDVKPETQQLTFSTQLKTVSVSQDGDSYFELPETTLTAESPLFTNLAK